MNENKKQDIAAAVLGMTVACILWLTILSRDVQGSGFAAMRPFHSFLTAWKEIRRSGIRSNFLGNVFLFTPIGVLVPIVSDRCRKWYRTVLVGMSFSLLIELIQLITARGCFDFDDLILNGIGAAFGYGLFWVAGSWLFCKPS